MNMAYLKYALGLLQQVANTGCARLQLQVNLLCTRWHCIGVYWGFGSIRSIGAFGAIE